MTVVQMRNTKEDAHDALRHTLDLAQCLQEATRFPLSVTDGDREVLAHRLKCINDACAPLLRMQPMTVGGRTNPTGGAA